LATLVDSVNFYTATLWHQYRTAKKIEILRPSSDDVLLPCRTKLPLGSTVERQGNNFDSDVVTESNQIQD